MRLISSLERGRISGPPIELHLGDMIHDAEGKKIVIGHEIC